MTDQQFFAQAVAESRAEYDNKKNNPTPKPPTPKPRSELRKLRETLFYTLEERLYFAQFKHRQQPGDKGIKKCNVPECLNRQYNSSLCAKHRAAIRLIPKKVNNG